MADNTALITALSELVLKLGEIALADLTTIESKRELQATMARVRELLIQGNGK